MKKLLMAVAFMAAALNAQTKVGYLSMQKLFEGYYKTVSANIVFEQRKQEVEDKLKLMRGDLEKAMAELRNLDSQAANELLSQAARDEAKKNLKIRGEMFAQKREEFERTTRSNSNDLRRLQNETENTLVQDLTAFVKNFAKTKGYTHVYDISGQTANRIPVLLVYPEQNDITAIMLSEINAGHESELKENQAKLASIRNKK